MQYTEFLRMEKIKRMLNFAAYASLVLDIAIAVVTLVSLHIYSQQLNKIQFFLNIALTVEVIVTLFLFAALLGVAHYQKIVERLAGFSSRLTGRRGNKNR